ncbi:MULTISPECIES: hypothetical protein [Exiguobacterium]|uniref:Uncharacterized protein n=2 Tax=Exiguobacterium TaxID=33986 RepID=A0ABY8AYU3_9BACL|nr:MULTISPECIES: hypothetical protein [Exiguobacterium]MCC9625154.1 hypothetical protein [Thalassospira sp. MA62]MCV9900659.1 hypothetical protein [Exiguobacterium sp. N5]MDT0193140.1 hypothetical protein [Exiguobacterium sp. BG5(2022)]WED55061.1 hypothetical protein OE059_13740 [Exiguobacterium profundum]
MNETVDPSTVDHSIEDVSRRLERQSQCMPAHLYFQLEELLNWSLEQEVVNQLYALLKKYDVLTDIEREERNISIQMLIDENGA